LLHETGVLRTVGGDPVQSGPSTSTTGARQQYRSTSVAVAAGSKVTTIRWVSLGTSWSRGVRSASPAQDSGQSRSTADS
jgi:hypothetical protein